MSRSDKKVRIALADDHPIFRDSLRELLSAEDDLELVAEVGDGHQVVEMVETHRPDVLLLDLIMPGAGALSVLRRIHELKLDTKVIILTLCADEATHVLAMRYGASGIVLKDQPTEFLIDGIRRVHEGGVCIDNKTMVLLMRRFSSPHQPLAGLTEREEEVVALLCEGLKNRDVADRLAISEGTVKTHLRRIFEKTGVADRMHLVLCAVGFELPLSDKG